MPYVKARYMPAGPIDPPDMARQIQALDDQGGLWALREDSEVGDWLRYVEEGGTVDPEGTEWPEVDTLPETKPAGEEVVPSTTMAEMAEPTPQGEVPEGHTVVPLEATEAVYDDMSPPEEEQP